MSKTNQIMTPVEIKIELMKKGITQTEISNRCDVTLPMVSHVINGKTKYLMYGQSRLIMEEISRVIEKPVSEIWKIPEMLN